MSNRAFNIEQFARFSDEQAVVTEILATALIRAGDLDVADHDEVHGAVNDSTEDAVFLSIYSAPDIGWEKAEA